MRGLQTITIDRDLSPIMVHDRRSTVIEPSPSNPTAAGSISELTPVFSQPDNRILAIDDRHSKSPHHLKIVESRDLPSDSLVVTLHPLLMGFRYLGRSRCKFVRLAFFGLAVLNFRSDRLRHG
jgi:hypothetical protein